MPGSDAAVARARPPAARARAPLRAEEGDDELVADRAADGEHGHECRESRAAGLRRGPPRPLSEVGAGCQADQHGRSSPNTGSPTRSPASSADTGPWVPRRWECRSPIQPTRLLERRVPTVTPARPAAGRRQLLLDYASSSPPRKSSRAASHRSFRSPEPTPPADPCRYPSVWLLRCVGVGQRTISASSSESLQATPRDRNAS